MEFALAIPILLLLIIGALQLGILFMARAGLRQAVNEGARYATIFPAPTDAQIQARVLSKTFGLQQAYITGPTISRGTSNGVAYVDINMSYNKPLDFVFMSVPGVTMQASRRAFQP